MRSDMRGGSSAATVNLSLFFITRETAYQLPPRYAWECLHRRHYQTDCPGVLPPCYLNPSVAPAAILSSNIDLKRRTAMFIVPLIRSLPSPLCCGGGESLTKTHLPLCTINLRESGPAYHRFHSHSRDGDQSLVSCVLSANGNALAGVTSPFASLVLGAGRWPLVSWGAGPKSSSFPSLVICCVCRRIV